MTRQIFLRIGAEPWFPTSYTKLIKELSFYDFPLAGIIEQDGRHYLFDCLDGHASDTNIWAYIPLSKRRSKRLQRLTSEKLRTELRKEYQRKRRRMIGLAMAIDGRIQSSNTHAIFDITSDPASRKGI